MNKRIPGELIVFIVGYIVLMIFAYYHFDNIIQEKQDELESLNLHILEDMDESDIGLNHNYSKDEPKIENGVVAYAELLTFDSEVDVNRGISNIPTYDITYLDKDGNEKYLQRELHIHYNQGGDKKEKFIVDGRGEYHIWLLRERKITNDIKGEENYE